MSENVSEVEAAELELAEDSIEQAYQALQDEFPGKVRPDERDGYEGIFIELEALVDAALFMRDELGFQYLSSVTGVDYINEGLLESVYHAYGKEGGALVFLRSRRSFGVCTDGDGK